MSDKETKNVKLKKELLRKVRETKIWIAIAVALSVFRIFLTYNLPITAESVSIHDDALMVDMAVRLLSGGWLGPYSCFAMPKGIVYPLYLALVHKSGISYLVITQLLYMLSAMLVVMALHKKERGYLADCLLYIVLIFNPVMGSQSVYLRIYRNALVPIEVLLVFAGILGMFMRLEEKNNRLIFWSLLSGFSVLALDMTREDSIWIMPFFVVASIVFGIMIFKMRYEMKHVSKKEIAGKVVLVLLPFFILFAGNTVVKEINYHYYGIRACTDTNETHVTDAIKAMYAVEDVNEIPFVSVSREKMQLLYANSPTLYSVWPCIESSLNEWADTENGNVTDAHFFWAIRDALTNAGYYQDAVETDAFYQKVAEELNDAMESGRLSKRSTMPSALMSPWRVGYLGELMDAYGLSYRFISSFFSCETAILESFDNGRNGIRLFEDMTNAKAVYPGELSKVASSLVVKQDILNGIFRIYSMVNQVMLPITLILFAGMCACMIFSKQFREKHWKTWLSALGILLSAFVLISGVAYTHISAYPAISASYLAGVYPLMLLFEGVVFLIVFSGCSKCFSVFSLSKTGQEADGISAL